MIISTPKLFRQIHDNEIPDFAKDPNKKIYEYKFYLDQLISTANRGESSFWRENIHRIFKQIIEERVLSMSGKEFDAFLSKNEFTHYSVRNSDLEQWTNVLIENNWHKGQGHLLIRAILFLVTYTAYRNNDFQTELTYCSRLPSEYCEEIFALTFIALLRKKKFVELQKLIESPQFQSFEDVRKFTINHVAWLRQNINEEFEISNNTYSAESEAKVKELILILEERRKSLNRREFASLDIEQLDITKQIYDSDNHNNYQIYKLLSQKSSKIDFFISKKLLLVQQNILESINWTPLMLKDYLFQLRLIDKYNRLPKLVLSAIKNALISEQVNDEFVKEVWDYCLTHMKRDQDVLKIWKELLEYLWRHLADNKDSNSIWTKKLISGFVVMPVDYKHKHNPYHGLHSTQVMPMLQLMAEVAPVELIKFYKTEDTIRLRFLYDGEKYDIPTGDGFGVGCLNDFNDLLYQNGVPYQLVALDLEYFKSTTRPLSTYERKKSNIQVITLINKANFERFRHKIKKQNIAGFADSKEDILPFFKNVRDLPVLNSKKHLDDISLENEPKFETIKTALTKLTPKKAWNDLLLACISYPLDGKPGKTWRKQIKILVNEIPKADFQTGLVLLHDEMIKGEVWFRDDEKLAMLRALTWICRLHPNENILYVLQQVAKKAYTKVPGGPRNAKLGNIALDTFSTIGTLEAYGAINNLLAKAKYSVYKRAIVRYSNKFEELLNVFPAEVLADKVIPSHEIVNGKKIISIGNCKAHLVVEGLKVKTSWENDKGKLIKSTPAALKKEFPVQLKSIKAEGKNIESTLSGQIARLENSWLNGRKWDFENWHRLFVKHPLLQIIGEKLIWQAYSEHEQYAFIPKKGEMLSQKGDKIKIDKKLDIRLWHPALAPMEEVLEWRNRIFEWQIKQPFKQAFREVYLLTPAEEITHDHSNRFAGHLLKGNTLYSLGKTRAWEMTYDGYPRKKIAEYGIIAELGIDGGVLYSNCTTQALSFNNIGDNSSRYSINRQPKVPLTEIPPVVLSEVMRDIDLFVAVSSITIDPYFDQNHTGNMIQHWREVTFGKKSKTQIAEVRKDLLERLLPMTKIADKVDIDGNYLHVDGKLSGYKINLSSGNILMKPNDQYLCIVPARNKLMEKRIFLPFEGSDQTMMVILSKAFLLAEDEKIKDESILSQIRRKAAV